MLFQVVARQRFRKLPLQAHFYPLSGLAYIEDSITRVSIVSGSPLGVTSLKEGQLQIMQDRRLSQDDNRGLNQGVMDNHPTPHMFRLLVEQREPACPQQVSYL
jgi:alpha-mannosidase II